jgi:hypothetical protein
MNLPCIFFFIFISIYSLYGGDLLWQFWIALHCTLIRSPLPSPSPCYPVPVTLEAITRGFINPIALCIWCPSTLLLHLHLLHSPPSHKYPPIHCICFTVLSFIINFKVDVQRGSLVYPSCEYASLWSVQHTLC